MFCTVHLFIIQNTVLNMCNEKSEWVENTTDATTQDFIMQKQQLEEALAPVWAKLTETRMYFERVISLCYVNKIEIM